MALIIAFLHHIYKMLEFLAFAYKVYLCL